MSDPRMPAARSPSVGGVRVVTLILWGRSAAWADRQSVLVDAMHRF
jgi:hypothetical protein